jgi:NAD(P)-dependent dehydrogenase (short-subunit alcohol dehydrogenase family)
MPATDRRVCVFTGVSGTLGTAFCRLHAADYHIAGIYHHEPPAQASQAQRLVDPLAPTEDVPENADAIFAIRADVTDDHDLARVVELTITRFGRIDLLINAAVYSIWASMLESDRLARSADAQFLVNVVAPFRLATAIAHDFWRARRDENIRANRHVINVSSLAGVHVYPDQGQGVYAASKAALNHLTLHMAHELAAIGVRVNAIAPNSFPRIVSTERVVQEMVRLDRGKMTGEIREIDRDAVDE